MHCCSLLIFLCFLVIRSFIHGRACCEVCARDVLIWLAKEQRNEIAKIRRAVKRRRKRAKRKMVDRRVHRQQNHRKSKAIFSVKVQSKMHTLPVTTSRYCITVAYNMNMCVCPKSFKFFTYSIIFHVQDVLKARGFPWPEMKKKKGKRK